MIEAAKTDGREDRVDASPGGDSRPDTDRPRGRDELVQWMKTYRESVGPSGDVCEKLIEDLLDNKALTPALYDPLLELLELLQMLSADPITVSCAILHVASQEKDVSTDIINQLPAQVHRQLKEFKKLKHYESGQSENSTERKVNRVAARSA